MIFVSLVATQGQAEKDYSDGDARGGIVTCIRLNGAGVYCDGMGCAKRNSHVALYVDAGGPSMI